MTIAVTGSRAPEPSSRTIDLAAGVRIITCESDASLLDFAWWMEQRRGYVLGIDCESNGQDQFSPRYRLRTVQISDGYESWVIDVSRVSLRNLAVLISRHPLFVAHYAEADIRFLVRGCPGSVRVDDHAVPHIIDTQTVLAWFDPRTVTSQDDAYGAIPLPRGLKPTVERLIPGQLLVWAEQQMHEEFRRLAPKGMRKEEDVRRHGFATIPFSDKRYVIYGGLDPLYTVRLYRMMMDVITGRGQRDGLAADLKLQWVCDLMTLRGLGVDGPYAGWLDQQLSDVIDIAAGGLALHGIKPSGMGASVGHAFERLGASSPKVSRNTGDASWDKRACSSSW